MLNVVVLDALVEDLGADVASRLTIRTSEGSAEVSGVSESTVRLESRRHTDCGNGVCLLIGTYAC